MNIFFAVNDSYVEQLCVAIVSVLKNNACERINFYVLTNDFSEDSKIKIENIRRRWDNWNIQYLTVQKEQVSSLKLNIDYITAETYFRYFIADLVPEIDKCLYLDADLVVNGTIRSLYDTNIEGCYCAGVRDLYIEEIKYKSKINFDDKDLYVNAGMLLMNLAKIREDNMVCKLLENTKELADKIQFQDQDVINVTFKGKIKEVDSVYNFTSHNVKLEKEKRKKAIVVHYTGKEKPWGSKCKNKLKNLWNDYFLINKVVQNQKLKIGLIIDEYFGGAGTAFGGYGFLARRYIAKYIPDNNIKVDVLLGKGRKRFSVEHFVEDGIDLYRLPRNRFMAKWWLKKKDYDIYLSIELTDDYVLLNVVDKNKRLVLWIQDPRPLYEWDEINTVKLFPEKCYYKQKIYDLVHKWYLTNRVSFITQGYFLNQKAKDLYQLTDDVEIKYCPNPVDIDNSFDIKTYKKKNKVIFLGRIESVKRGWLFCEIAKRMPQYEFYMLGQSFREKDENTAIMSKYKDIPNLHFTGHVDGIEKENHIKDAKILVNTSIHEALPISFLEALSYGTLLVSNRNPENLTSKFGIYVGNVLGDGFDKVDLYVDAISSLMNDDCFIEKAQAAIDYVKEIHNVPRFVKDLKDILYNEALKTKV